MPNKIQNESFVFFSSSSPIHAEQDLDTTFSQRVVSAIGDTGYSLLVRIAAKVARYDPNTRENGNGSALVCFLQKRDSRNRY